MDKWGSVERKENRNGCGREVDKENVQRKGHMDRGLTEVCKGRTWQWKDTVTEDVAGRRVGQGVGDAGPSKARRVALTQKIHPRHEIGGEPRLPIFLPARGGGL